MNPLSVADRRGALRIIDANLDRALEGLRVVEEYARFVRDSADATQEFKQLRHRLQAAVSVIPTAELLSARNTPEDVGRAAATDTEYKRGSVADVVRANLSRVQQALRSIEEYGKLVDVEMARAVESIRYGTYTLEARLLQDHSRRAQICAARIYVLLAGMSSEQEFARRAEALVAAQADVIQLRDKALNDRELLLRARVLREITADSATLFIMNDRPDLALLSEADGVHVGQTELPIEEVRKLVDPDMLVGISTHSLQQARAAVESGADYIGCGPTFHSSTKSFEQFPGTALLAHVAANIPIPAFAIGGINEQNVSQVAAAGIKRIAVSGVVAQAENPSEVIRRLREKLIESTPAETISQPPASAHKE